MGRAYNTENFAAPVPKERIVANFEEVGRRIDQEFRKLRRYLEKEVKPATQRKAIEALRKASRRLADAASELEARVTRKR